MREKTMEEYLEEMKQMMEKSGASRKEQAKETESVDPVIPVLAEPLPLDGEGTLIVVVNSAESRPLQGATVNISEANGGKILYTLVTDQSGKTSPVKLAAPLRANSLTPNDGEIVYGLYDITASADNFVESKLKNIPIFDSVISIQQMRLLWIPAAGGFTEEQTENESNPYTL